MLSRGVRKRLLFDRARTIASSSWGGRTFRADWCAYLELRDLKPGRIVRHRLAALSSLFEHLCESNAVTHNPVKGVKRPPVENYEGKTPALGDHQARVLLEAPDGVSLKGKRDRAILATLLYHALRREELCKLTVKDFRHERRGVAHLKVLGKGSKTRYRQPGGWAGQGD